MSALVSKYQPLDDSVCNAEGLRVISVEKIQAAIVIMEKEVHSLLHLQAQLQSRP